jgi:hypothetical protein
MLPGNPSPGSLFTKRIIQSNPVNEIKIKTISENKNRKTRLLLSSGLQNVLPQREFQKNENRIESPRREDLPAAASCAVGDGRYRRPHAGADKGGPPDEGPVAAVTGAAGHGRAPTGVDKGRPPDVDLVAAVTGAAGRRRAPTGASGNMGA